MGEAETFEEPEFGWGKRSGTIGKNKKVRFYDSFTYDKVEYFRYDCVYLYEKGVEEPYIGKLIKMWETIDKQKKGKVLWFFQSSEISNFLQDDGTLENELFLASGEGSGLTNIVPLEATAGKCNVVCISKDSRNRQPSDQEIANAEYVFRRTFDVGSCKIKDEMGETIAKTDVKFLLNKEHAGEDCSNLKFGFGMKGIDENAVQNNVTEECEAVKTNGHCNDIATNEAADLNKILTRKTGSGPCEEQGNLEKDNPAELKAKPESSTAEKASSDPCWKQGDTARANETKENVSSRKDLSRSNANSKNRKTIKVKRAESVELDDRPSKKAKVSSDATGHETVAPIDTAGDEDEVKPPKGSSELEKGPMKRLKRGDKTTEVCNGHDTVASIGFAVDEDDVKPPKGSSEIEKGPMKRLKHGDKTTEVCVGHDSVAPIGSAVDEDDVKPPKVSSEAEKGPLKRLKRGDKKTEVCNGKLPKVFTQQVHDEDHKKEGQQSEGTPKPDTDRSKWFGGLPWEDRLKTAHEKRRLVLLQNLDPSYTSAEVEDIVRQGFKEKCSAKMIQRTASSSPHSGQAFVIFEKKDVADMVIDRLEKDCLLLPNGRPLLAQIVTPCFPEKKLAFSGHLGIDKLRYQKQREQREAVSTSHCAQPCTIEYEMSMEWSLLQEQTDLEWKKLYKVQGQDLRELKIRRKGR